MRAFPKSETCEIEAPQLAAVRRLTRESRHVILQLFTLLLDSKEPGYGLHLCGRVPDSLVNLAASRPR